MVGREGPHAKYHYMICGVQGDFTRSLVNDPPKTLWTRELKVGIFTATIGASGADVAAHSSPVFRTHQPYTSVVFVSAQVLVSARRCLHAYNRPIGEQSSDIIKVQSRLTCIV